MTASDVAEDDLLPDDFLSPESSAKGTAKALVRTPAQLRALEKRRAEIEAEAALAAAQDEAKAAAGRMAQVVNLTIAGYSYEEIGLSIGATADEVEQMLLRDAQRYIKTQPALRTYVRNWISGKFCEMIETDWPAATDTSRPDMLDHQDRVMRMLAQLGRLHGAEAPTQTELKIDTPPEAVDALVARIAKAQGVGYDIDVFDIEVIEDAHAAADEAVSGNIEEADDGSDPI